MTLHLAVTAKPKIGQSTGECRPLGATHRPRTIWLTGQLNYWIPRDKSDYRNVGLLGENAFIRTDKNGVAAFRFSDPLPERLIIRSGMAGYWEECSPNNRAFYLFAQILKTGFSEEGLCGDVPNISTKFQPNPGDVYIFPVHHNLWQRLTKCGDFGCH